MGTKKGMNGGGGDDEGASLKQTQKILIMVLMRWCWCGWLIVSLTGGLILGVWVHEFQPEDSQLWMVPIGLVLFVTPIFVCLSVLISNIFSFKKNGDVPSPSQLVPSPDDSISDPEK